LVETQEVVLALRYGVAVFVAVLGVIQAASAHAGLRGLLFFPWSVRIRFWRSRHCRTLTCRHSSYIFAGITVLPSVWYLFVWNSYNEVGIIEGAEQAGLFVLCTLVGGVFSLLLSSLINHWRLQYNQTQAQGLEALKEVTWFQSFWRRWAERVK